LVILKKTAMLQALGSLTIAMIAHTSYVHTNPPYQVEQFNRRLAAARLQRANDNNRTGTAQQQQKQQQQHEQQQEGAAAWVSPFLLVVVKAALPVVLVNGAGAGAMGWMEGWTALDT